MMLALAVGILLQVAVTEVPVLITLFGTVRLSVEEWGRLLLLSMTPLVVHELLVVVGMAGAGERRPSCERAESQE